MKYKTYVLVSLGESGSMFPELASDSKILAVTASNAKESSWGTYCGDEADPHII